MTHDELLAKINHNLANEVWLYNMGEALRAVVELHPMWTDYIYSETDKELVEFCGCCQERYPCKTIQAIESALH